MKPWLKSWRWAWWWARQRRRPGPPPAPTDGPAWPHPPYYGDAAQLPDRDYATKARKD